MDDHVFPSYSSSKAKSKNNVFGESECPEVLTIARLLILDVAGDAFVRELDMSQITLRLKEKQDRKGENDDEEDTIAKLQGNTLDILQRCLVSN